MKRWVLVWVTVLALVGTAVVVARAPVAAATLDETLKSAQRIVLALDGVPGECVMANHEKEIEIISCNYSVDRPSYDMSGTKSYSTRATFGEVAFTKNLDAASPKMFEGCASGKHYRSATFFFIRSVNGVDVLSYKLTLEDVVITSFAQSATALGPIVDHVKFAYSKIKIEYTPYSSMGKPGSLVKSGWDITNNTMCQ